MQSESKYPQGATVTPEKDDEGHLPTDNATPTRSGSVHRKNVVARVELEDHRDPHTGNVMTRRNVTHHETQTYKETPLLQFDRDKWDPVRCGAHLTHKRVLCSMVETISWSLEGLGAFLPRP